MARQNGKEEEFNKNELMSLVKLTHLKESYALELSN